MSNTEQQNLFGEGGLDFLSGIVMNVRLPEWPDTVRVMPNELIRSSLFCVGNRNQPRRYLRNEKIASLGDGAIRYTGEELRQDDEIVWLHILHLVKRHKLGECVEFLPYTFLKDIDWPRNGGGAERLRNCLSRMAVTGVTISSTRIGAAISVSLIRKFLWRDEYTGEMYKSWKVWLEPEIVMLFDADYLTHLNWSIRRRLPSGIATKLQGYWSSHRTPYPESIERLALVCGSGMEKRHFKVKLIIALKEMVATGFLSGWNISQNGVVSITRA